MVLKTMNSILHNYSMYTCRRKNILYRNGIKTMLDKHLKDKAVIKKFLIKY